MCDGFVRNLQQTRQDEKLVTHTQTSLPAIGAILIAQRTDDLTVGVGQAKRALGARGGGGGAGGHCAADVSLPRPCARAQRSSCFAAMGNAGWSGRPVVADDRASSCRELKLELLLAAGARAQSDEMSGTDSPRLWWRGDRGQAGRSQLSVALAAGCFAWNE